MGSKHPYLWLSVLCLLCIMVGWVSRGVAESGNRLQMSMAWGYEEGKNVWNRIRVNEKGYVICTRE